MRQAVQLGMSDNITIPGLGDLIEAGGKTIERSLLSAVIKPRIEEVVELLTTACAPRGWNMPPATGLC